MAKTSLKQTKKSFRTQWAADKQAMDIKRNREKRNKLIKSILPKSKEINQLSSRTYEQDGIIYQLKQSGDHLRVVMKRSYEFQPKNTLAPVGAYYYIGVYYYPNKQEVQEYVVKGTTQTLEEMASEIKTIRKRLNRDRRVKQQPNPPNPNKYNDNFPKRRMKVVNMKKRQKPQVYIQSERPYKSILVAVNELNSMRDTKLDYSLADIILENPKPITYEPRNEPIKYRPRNYIWDSIRHNPYIKWELRILAVAATALIGLMGYKVYGDHTKKIKVLENKPIKERVLESPDYNSPAFNDKNETN